MDPRSTTWYDLMEKKLLPVAAEQCVEAIGFCRLDMLVVEWMDHSVFNLAVEMMP